MFRSVDVPLWALILIVLFAAVTAASHLFIPPVRWYLRRRLEQAVSRLNARLEHPIRPFNLARRHDTILRLVYDPAVAEAIARHAAVTGEREDAAFIRARRYAREIVPSFSATVYFTVATRAARWLSTALYDVRLSPGGPPSGIAADATVIYVMNHRSNMDYVLVTWLVAERTALTFAVGEWARIWPLSLLVRSMGAYFIRRRARTPLYRRVLARYVQMATRGGVTQAIFPEGGLSLDGRVAPARLGLLSYIVAGFDRDKRAQASQGGPTIADAAAAANAPGSVLMHRAGDGPAGAGDVVFVPVSLAYDRVIEDRILTEAAARQERRFRAAFVPAAMFVLRWLLRRLSGRERRFGIAAVAFGAPVSLRAMGEGATVKALGERLMSQIAKGVPVLPVPLMAAALADGPATAEALIARAGRVADGESAAGRWICVDGPDWAARALDRLLLRGLAVASGGVVGVAKGKDDLIAFYAATLAGPPAGTCGSAGALPARDVATAQGV